MVKYAGNKVKTNQRYFYSPIAHRLKGKPPLTCRRPALCTKHNLLHNQQTSKGRGEKRTMQKQAREHELRASPKGYSVAVKQKNLKQTKKP